MPFTKFDGKIGRATSLRPSLTVGRSGILGINKKAVEKYGFREYKYAALFYDEVNHVVGIRPTNDEEEANCTIRDRQSGMDISATSFFKYFKIEHEITKRYDLERDDRHDMYVAKVV